MNIRDFVSKDHIESPFEIMKTQGAAIQAYMLENEQLQKELKSVYDKLTNKDKEIKRLNNIINELEKYLIDVKQFVYLDKLKELKEGK